MATKKKTPRRVPLTPGDAIRLTRAEAEASLVRQQFMLASRAVQGIMDSILAGTLKDGEQPVEWTLEVDGDKAELVEVAPDE